ncbi:MAG: hypothetical protein IPK10_13375 [Bacteroidetes bacterium]|nr:hypothetical protein [Bacteroidota bacterium]
MKKLILSLYLLCFCSLQSFSQQDSVRNSVTTNIISGVLFQEAGLYYNIKITSSSLVELSYAHRFRDLTIIKNGGDGGEFKLWKQTSDIVRIGFKSYHEIESVYSNFTPYFYARMSYWNLHTPKFTTRSGSNSTFNIKREVVSWDRNLVNMALGFGKSEQMDEHLFIDFFVVAGFSIGTKRIHKYTYDSTGNGTALKYPENTIENTLSIFPTIELGFNVGYFW